jgi:hypothetical protein
MPLLATAAMTAALAALQPATLPIDLGEATRISASEDGSALIVEGPITDGAYASFQRAARAYPIARQVILRSPGGLMFEADRIAHLVRERRMATYAQTLCASACTVILIAGRDRAAAPGTRVGFHRPDVSLSRTPATTMRLTRQLYERAGLAPTFTARIYATPFESVWYPGVDEMIRAGVLTRRVLPTATFAARVSHRSGG